MSQFIKQRIRCALKPSRFFEEFKLKLTGANPQAAKAGSCQWEFFFFDDNDTPFDISNIASLTLQLVSAAGAVVVTKTISRVPSAAGSLNPGCTLDQWNAGSGEHATIVLSSAEMNQAAGAYTVTVFGFTDDEAGENDPFGKTTLTLIEMYMTAAAAPPVAGRTPVYTDDLIGALAGVIRRDNPKGVTITLRSPDGLHLMTIGVSNTPEEIKDIV
jgi:hypothetical protein